MQFFIHAHSHYFWWRVRSSSNVQTKSSAFAMLVNLEWSTQQVWKNEGSTIKYEFNTMFQYIVLYFFLEGFSFFKLWRMIRFVFGRVTKLMLYFLRMFERVKWLSKSDRCQLIYLSFIFYVERYNSVCSEQHAM